MTIKIDNDAFVARMRAACERNAKKAKNPIGSLTFTQTLACCAHLKSERPNSADFEKWLMSQIRAGVVSVTDGRFWLRGASV
jgi:hypothetical protein